TGALEVIMGRTRVAGGADASIAVTRRRWNDRGTSGLRQAAMVGSALEVGDGRRTRRGARGAAQLRAARIASRMASRLAVVPPPPCARVDLRDDGSVLRRILLLPLLMGLAACSSPASVQPASMRQGAIVFGGGDRLRVRIAETEAERAAGLMHVMALAPDDGMAFVFNQPVTDRFWMKDTLIPLSVAFVGEDGRVISLSDMDPC